MTKKKEKKEIVKRITELIEGEGDFISTGFTKFKVTTKGKSRFYEFPITTRGQQEAIDESEALRPYPPIKKKNIEKDSLDGIALNLKKDSFEYAPDKTDKDYLKKLESFVEDQLWIVCIPALDVKITNKDGSEATFEDKKRILMDKGIGFQQLQKINHDIYQLTAYTERKINSL